MGLIRHVFRRSFDQVERYAPAREPDGPLRVVLGDSAAQAAALA